jgi:hypothetical protein
MPTTEQARLRDTQTYLGDGLYARFDGHQVWLETMEGNSVALEPEVVKAFSAYVQSIRDAYGVPDWGK